MELVIFLTLTGLGSLFVLAAALSKDRTNLVPAGILFLLTGLFLLSGTGLEIPDGEEYEYSEVNGSYEKTSATPQYSEVDFPVDNVDFDHVMSIVLMLIGVYFLGISGARTRFFSLMR